MTVTISDEILAHAHLSELQIKVELAITLFQQERLTLGQAAGLAQVPQLEFQRLLASRQISLHYGIDQLDNDLKRAEHLPLI